MSCQECLSKEKKIRVIISDHEFQLRKITEDKAEEKALFEISVQKELRKWQEKYHKQKLDHEENSKKWLNTIDSNATACQKRLSDFKEQKQKEVEEYKRTNHFRYEQERELTLHRHSEEIKKLKETHGSQVKTIHQSYKNQISSIESRLLSEIERIKKEAKERQEKLINEYDSLVLGLKSENNASERQNFRLQEEHRRERSKYFSEIYDHKSMISALQANANQLKSYLQGKEKQLEQKKAEMAEMCDHHLIELGQAEKEREKLKKQWQEEMQQQLKTFYEKELLITEQYEDSVKNIEEKIQTEKSLYSNNLLDIRACIENRPSRSEDLEEIMALRDKLNKKEKQYDLLERQMKHIQLELDNKEDTYNRMFIPSMNSAHLIENNLVRRKDLKLKRAGKSVSTVRDILHAVNVNTNNLPALNSIDKKYLPPKSNKIL